MTSIDWKKLEGVTSATVADNYLRFSMLPHCRLRSINARNDTDVCLITATLIRKVDAINTNEGFAIFNREQVRAAGYDVVWEGDIEIDGNTDVDIIFEELGGGAYPTAGDVIKALVGIEYI